MIVLKIISIALIFLIVFGGLEVTWERYETNDRNEGTSMDLEFYIDDNGDERWRLVANNNREVANPGEGYRNFDDMLNTLLEIQGFFLTHQHDLELYIREKKIVD